MLKESYGDFSTPSIFYFYIHDKKFLGKQQYVKILKTINFTIYLSEQASIEIYFEKFLKRRRRNVLFLREKIRKKN